MENRSENGRESQETGELSSDRQYHGKTRFDLESLTVYETTDRRDVRKSGSVLLNAFGGCSGMRFLLYGTHFLLQAYHRFLHNLNNFSAMRWEIFSLSESLMGVLSKQATPSWGVTHG